PVTGAPGLDLALPTEYDNEANLAALGELWFGGGAELGDFVHVSGEIGIGAGIVVDGRVFRGAHGFAGELGHLVAEPGGPPCSCGGRGCLEQVAGQEALLRAAGLPVAGPDAPDDPVRALVGLLEAGDPAALAAVERAGRALGGALAAAVNLIDPDAIVLGGVFSPLAGWIRPPVEAVLAGGPGSLRRGAPPVAVSGLAEGAAVLGAAGLVIERVIADPALLLCAALPCAARETHRSQEQRGGTASSERAVLEPVEAGVVAARPAVGGGVQADVDAGEAARDLAGQDVAVHGGAEPRPAVRPRHRVGRLVPAAVGLEAEPDRPRSRGRLGQDALDPLLPLDEADPLPRRDEQDVEVVVLDEREARPLLVAGLEV